MLHEEDYESQFINDFKDTDSYNQRLAFVKRVYGILAAQFTFTTLFVYLSHQQFNTFFVQENNCNNDDTGNSCTLSEGAEILFWICCSLILIIGFTVSCYTTFARLVPINYIFLGIFTLCEACIVAVAAAIYSFQTVMLVAILIVSLSVTLIVYAFTTRTDFTTTGGLSGVLAWTIFAFGILTIWITLGNGVAFEMKTIAIAVISVCIYGIYLVYDMQFVLGGGQFELTLDDYILGALVLYIDIVVLFIRILQIIGTRTTRT